MLLVLPGGPYWRRRDQGAWQIPKGAIEPGEDAPAAALREVREEIGVTIERPLVALATIRQTGGKQVEAFACRQDIDCGAVVSAHFDLEWPPRSGRIQSFPEVERARWFALGEARTAMLSSQRPLLDAIELMLAPEI